jgi:hypothetical protein
MVFDNDSSIMASGVGRNARLHPEVSALCGHLGMKHARSGQPRGQVERTTGRRIEFEELSPDEFRSETEGSWPRPAVDMLLAAWGATIGTPAFITSTVLDILGSQPRSFRQWVADQATDFTEGPLSDEA